MTNRRKYINHKVTRRDFYYSKYWNRNRECELLSCLIPQRHRRLVRMEIYGHTHNDNPGSQFSDYHWQEPAWVVPDQSIGGDFVCSRDMDGVPPHLDGIGSGVFCSHPISGASPNRQLLSSRLSKNRLVLCYMTIITEITSATRHLMHN